MAKSEPRTAVEGTLYGHDDGTFTWALDCQRFVVEGHDTFKTESAARADARRVARMLNLRIKRWV